MNYEETIDYLFNATPVFEKTGASAYKEGLGNTIAFDEHFNHPHTHYATIHVAGTNGKGSCSHTLAAILQSAGYKVGLYTSPHLIDFRERIRINGECISKQYVVDFVEKERKFFEPLSPSFFELTTAMALKYFADEKIDIAVIEVGLGGRLDCTNIITPILSVITNISFDHTQFLGNTLAKIAGEKAGIIKHNVPVVIGEATDETRPVFEETAQRLSAPIFFAEDEPEVLDIQTAESNGLKLTTQNFGTLRYELQGAYQAKNANTILKAVRVLLNLGVIKNVEPIIKGFANVCNLTGLMGRWQKLSDKPLTICDTGHNVGGWQYLSKQISAQPCHTLRIVFGMVDDKDINHVMDLLPQNAVYYFTQATTHRAIPCERVMTEGEKHNLHGQCYATVSNAYNQAKSEATPDDFIFVGGSSYIVADLLTYLKNNK
jgi:dihydrofolate synthase / folylpolyglutamate synthase